MTNSNLYLHRICPSLSRELDYVQGAGSALTRLNYQTQPITSLDMAPQKVLRVINRQRLTVNYLGVSAQCKHFIK